MLLKLEHVPPADCPACGLPAQKATAHHDGSIITASYVCFAQHLWSTRWMTADHSEVV